MKIVIIGANGTIGVHVSNALKAAGHEVIAVGRKPGAYQADLVYQSIPCLRDGVSITLVSGSLSEDPIAGGAVASTVDRAVEGFVMAAAVELPKNLRINVVSPTLLKDSEAKFGPYFPGETPVADKKVAMAFKKSVLGVQTGKTFFVLG